MYLLPLLLVKWAFQTPLQHNGHMVPFPQRHLFPKFQRIFDVSTEYLKTGIGTAATSETHSPDNSAPIEPDTFQFERFVHLCKQQGKMQSHLYDLVGLPSKAGSNLKRTKKGEARNP